MKKFLCLCMCTLFAPSILSTVFAADYVSDNDGRYNIEINGLQPETEYAILIIAGDYTNKDIPEISEDNLIYINQATSDSKGILNFCDFIPMTDSVGTVLISGENAPLKSGLILNDDGFGYIAGRIISYTPNDNINKIIIPDRFTEIAADAFFTATNIKNIFLPATITTIAKNAFTVGTKLFVSPNSDEKIRNYTSENTETFVMGDYNGDKTVDKDDFDGILMHFAMGKSTNNGISESFKTYFDLNFDGKVTLLDVSVLLEFLCGKIRDFFI